MRLPSHRMRKAEEGGLPVDSGEGKKATSNELGPGAAKQMSPGFLEAEPGWKIIITRASP